MLPKKRRLSTEEFDEVFSDGKTARSGFLSARFLKGKPYSKASVVVPKKTESLSVNRNVAKRKIYGELENLWDHFPKKTWGIFFVQNINLSDRERLSSDLKNLLAKLS